MIAFGEEPIWNENGNDRVTICSNKIRIMKNFGFYPEYWDVDVRALSLTTKKR